MGPALPSAVHGHTHGSSSAVHRVAAPATSNATQSDSAAERAPIAGHSLLCDLVRADCRRLGGLCTDTTRTYAHPSALCVCAIALVLLPLFPLPESIQIHHDTYRPYP